MQIDLEQDPKISLLNLESSSREYRMISLPRNHQMKCSSIDTDFGVEPWNDNSNTFINQEVVTQPAPPKNEQLRPKSKILAPRTPCSKHYNRQRSTETPQPQARAVQVMMNRPISCHHSTFTDLGLKIKIPQYNKVVEKMFDGQQNNNYHRSPRKNSTGQYRQICLKNILYSKKSTPSSKIIKVTNKVGNQFTWTDYYRFIQQSPQYNNNVSAKKKNNNLQQKSVTMVSSDKDNTLKNFRLKLKTLSLKQNN